jgi:hypothetical protein
VLRFEAAPVAAIGGAGVQRRRHVPPDAVVYSHLPLLMDMGKPRQTQRPFSTQRPWIDESTGLSLQVWFMPTVQVELGPTQP